MNQKDQSLRKETYEDWNLVIKYDPDVFDPLYEILLEKIEKRIDKMIESNVPKDLSEMNLNLKYFEKKNLQYYKLALEDVKELLK